MIHKYKFSQIGYEDLCLEDQPGHSEPLAGQGGHEDLCLEHGDRSGHLGLVVGQGGYVNKIGHCVMI